LLVNKTQRQKNIIDFFGPGPTRSDTAMGLDITPPNPATTTKLKRTTQKECGFSFYDK